MHPTWSRHSTRLTQISQPPKFIEKGHCSICFPILSHSELSFFCLRKLFSIPILFYFTGPIKPSYKTDSPPSTLHTIALSTASTSDSQTFKSSCPGPHQSSPPIEERSVSPGLLVRKSWWGNQRLQSEHDMHTLSTCFTGAQHLGGGGGPFWSS